MPRSVLRVTAGNHYDYNDDNHYYDYDQDNDQEDGKIKCNKWEEEPLPPHLVLRILNPESHFGVPSLFVYIHAKRPEAPVVLRNIWTTPNLSCR